ncbi:MAG: alpha/beta hydrolase family protein [Gammaproteobacteria bacterium]
MTAIHADQVNIAAADGTSCIVTFFDRQTAENPPVILCAPALGVSARSYRTLAEHLAADGNIVITADHRGIGESSVRASRTTDFGYAETLSVDWPVLIDTIRSRHPLGPLLILGHSLGGQLGSLYAAIHPDRISGLILVASCSVYYKGWGCPAGLAVLAGTQLAAFIAQLMGYFPGKKLGFGGNEARRLMRDWARNARSGRYDIENCPQDFENLLGLFDGPVLSISIAGDTFAPPLACNNLTGKLKAAQLTKRRVHVAGESGRKRHFDWLRSPSTVCQEIKTWLGSQIFPTRP